MLVSWLTLPGDVGNADEQTDTYLVLKMMLVS
jgi:hypothetical protein